MQYKMEKNFLDGFSARLKSLRGNDTLAVFAGKLGISLQTYQHYESGRRKPTVAFVIQVCQLTGEPSDRLLGLSQHNGERLLLNGDSVVRKAEAIIQCAEMMKNALGEKIAELRRVL